MRKLPWYEAEKYRWADAPGGYASCFGDDFGVFQIPGPMQRTLRVLASSGEGWEHVSVSLPTHCPNWPEMSFVKDLFWDEYECVMQLHVPKSDHVNHHPYCLHLWKPIGVEIPRPNSILVGPKVVLAGA